MPLPVLHYVKAGFLNQWVGVDQRASVGLNGVNQPGDVTLVQKLLNAVPSGKGGPSTPLVVDGLIGLNTRTAIGNYQAAKGLIVDRRIDVGKATITALVADAAKSGLPTDPRLIVPIPATLKPGLKYLFPDSIPSYACWTLPTVTIPTVTVSDWKLRPNLKLQDVPDAPWLLSGNIEIEKVGATPQVLRRINFVGKGGGIGPDLAAALGSLASIVNIPFTTYGSRIFLLNTPPAYSVPLDLAKGTCVIISSNSPIIGTGVQTGGTLVIFNNFSAVGYIQNALAISSSISLHVSVSELMTLLP